METKEKETQLGYRVAKIQTTKFSYVEYDEQTVNLLFDNSGRLRFSVSVDFCVNNENSSLQLDISTLLMDDETENTIVEHTGRTVFFVPGVNEVYNDKNDTYLFPDEFVVQINSIAYTHARALLSVELSPTVFKDKYFLPVIDPHCLLPKDKNCKISKK